jgi:GT2 family glycosyltransferase
VKKSSGMAGSNDKLESIYVVVLAWNHFEDTRECLQSILASEEVKLKVIVVDNGSTDGTKERLGCEFPQVHIICSARNLGVSGGYNLGIEQAMRSGADYILIANNDISVHPCMVPNLYTQMSQKPSMGIAMPKIFHYYGDRNRIWAIGGYWRPFPPTVKMLAYNAPDKAEYQIARPIDYAPSCCYLIRRSVVEKIGLFDARYFFYFDDWDYSARVTRAGFSIWFIPDAVMWHKVSLSTQKGDRPFFWWQNMGRSAFRFYTKYCTKAQLVSFSGWFFIREILKLKPRRSVAFLSGIIHEAHLAMAKESDAQGANIGS